MGRAGEVTAGGDVSAIDLVSCDSQPNQIWQAHEPY